MNENEIRQLSKLDKWESGIIEKIDADEKEVKKFASLGLTAGAQISVLKSKPPMLIKSAGTSVAVGEEFAKKIKVRVQTQNIVLVGNPNVGKSQIFTRLTGVKAVSSNFPGSTVEMKQSDATFRGRTYNAIDLPGVYNLSDPSRAGQESVKALNSIPYNLIIYIMDAFHLERSLFLGLELLSLQKPVLFVINKAQSARAQGISINVKKMEEKLGSAVVAVEAMSGEGFKTLERKAAILLAGKGVAPEDCPLRAQFAAAQDDASKWRFIGEIIKDVQKLEHKHPSFLEQLAELSTRPVTGAPIALIVMVISFFVIRHGGEGLINLLTPLFENYYVPFVTSLFGAHAEGFWGVLLLGGTGESFGLLTGAVQIAFIDVLSYVLVFYAVFEFWTDLGYLPRLSVLLDGILHKVGIHGYGAIPIMMGLGCKVPALMAVRTLESRRERIIASALVLILAPCISQSAMIFFILRPFAWYYTVLVFGVLAAAGIAAGVFLNKIMKGNPPEMFMEIPRWQMPRLADWTAKVWMQIKEYIKEAVPLIILGILLINAAQQTGLLDVISRIFEYPVQTLLGLPKESVSVIILGFMRKDISIGLLEPFGMSAAQIVTASVFMSMYLPCASALFVMMKEVGIKDATKICALTFTLAFLCAFLLRVLL